MCFPYGGFLQSWVCGREAQASQGRGGGSCCSEPVPADGSILLAPCTRPPVLAETEVGSSQSPPVAASAAKRLRTSFVWFFFSPFCTSNATRRTGGREESCVTRRIKQALGEAPEGDGELALSLPQRAGMFLEGTSQSDQLLGLALQPTCGAPVPGDRNGPSNPMVAEQDPRSAEGVNPPSEEQQRRKSNCCPALKLFCRFFSIQQTLKRGKKNSIFCNQKKKFPTPPLFALLPICPPPRDFLWGINSINIFPFSPPPPQGWCDLLQDELMGKKRLPQLQLRGLYPSQGGKKTPKTPTK